MDVIEKFLHEVSWKFDKGYPDITNEQDILLLDRLLKEIGVGLNELTISPDYQSRGEFNPYYIIDDIIDKEIRDILNDKNIQFDDILYKAVKSPGENVIVKKGKFPFELFSDEETSLNTFIQIPATKVKSHRGQKTRKDSTASSNVNEFLSLYFLIHNFSSVENFMKEINSKGGDTGVLTGEGNEVTYERLVELIEKDESPDRDIKIGANNAKAVKKDLGETAYKNLYWTPRAKPANINPKNPSDIILELEDGNFIGYSNKIATGKDVTPKFNTNMVAFFSENGSEEQALNIKTMINKSWDDASKEVPSSATNAKQAISQFKIEDEKYSETSSRSKFAELARSFQKDNLAFYGKDFYYIFRNNLIENLKNYLQSPLNLKYFLNSIASRTYGKVIENETPCPYKLLIGKEDGESVIKDVSEDSVLRDVVSIDSTDDIKDIKNEYDGSSQSFKINFKVKLGTELKSITIPVTLRTRASGGWSGKNLYITSSGVKID